MKNAREGYAVRICFVCLGNICRSPTAEGVMRKLLREAGLAGRVLVESAGTGDWHVGEPPDPRTRKAASARGVELESKARHFTAAHFADYDYVIGLDLSNVRNLQKLTKDEVARGRIHLLRDFEPGGAKGEEVPDPYYGGPKDFDHVFTLCERACMGLLAHIRAQHPELG